jgi:C4-dicarboxylate transporter DctM subunit
MLATIFISMLAPMLLLGLSMVSSYALAFIIPCLATGQQVFSLSTLVGWLAAGAGKDTYVAIALFVISGELMSKGRLTERIFDIFAYLFGDFRSCFPLVAVLTSLFYGMISGSGIAVVAAVGCMVLPYLVEMGYDVVYFAAMLACAGSLGQLIPPSSAILQTASMMEDVDTAQCFKVAMVMGLTCGLFLLVMTVLHCRKDGGNREKIEARVKELRAKGFGKVFADSIWALLCPAIILGGIFSNIFTTAEAAAVSVVYAIIVSLVIYRTVDLKELWNTILGSVKAVAKLAMLLAFAVSFSKLLGAFGLDVVISQAASTIFGNRVSFIIMTVIIMSVAMLVMNPGAIVTPIVYPVAKAFGVELNVYCAGLSGLGAIGSLTPPFGMSLFVIAPIANKDPMDICRKVLPLWLGMTIIIALFMIFPGLATWVL